MSRNDSNSNGLRASRAHLSYPSGSTNQPEGDFDAVLARMKAVFGVDTDTDLAKELGLKQGSISAAKIKKSVPAAWVTAVALKHGASADWILTGEGEMLRSSTKFAGVTHTRDLVQGKVPGARPDHSELDANHPTVYNDSTRKDVSIADLLAKTARVLESSTVYRDALRSDIEAFNHSVILDERVKKMEEQFGQALASLQEQLRQIQAENKTIRQELEEARAASTVRDQD